MDMGETLRVAREQRDLSLDELSTKTKISTLALRAIEENDIQRLPGGIFLRGFLRAYAREVGLNVEDTVSRYVAQFEPRSGVVEEGNADPSILEAALANVEPRPIREPAAPAGSRLGLVAVIALSLCVLAYLTFYQLQPVFEPTVPFQEPDPLALASSGNVPVTAGSEPATTADEPSTIPEPVATASDTAAASGAAPTTGSEPAAAAGQSAVIVSETAAAVQEPVAATVPAGNALVLTIQTSGPCWVSAIVGGRTLIYRLMQADERETIESGNGVELRVGDPATFAFQINGATGTSLGQAGEAVTVHITADNYQRFIAPAPTP